MLNRVAICALILSLAACATFGSRNIAGDWAGALQVPQGDLRLLFHFSQVDGEIDCSLESPDQEGVIPCGEVTRDGNSLSVTVPTVNAQYTASLKGDEMSGEWSQAGFNFDLDLVKVD